MISDNFVIRSFDKLICATALGATLAACTTPGGAPVEAPAPPAIAGAKLGPMPPLVISQNVAVLALVDRARSDAASGNEEGAGAALERALRIEPRNAVLWHELSRLRLAQGQYQQAEVLAKKSNAWARDNKRLRAANFRVIAESHIARGDPAAAQQALDKAKELEE